jgi:hypothetical protein
LIKVSPINATKHLEKKINNFFRKKARKRGDKNEGGNAKMTSSFLFPHGDLKRSLKKSTSAIPVPMSEVEIVKRIIKFSE